MIPVILTFRYQLPTFEQTADTPTPNTPFAIYRKEPLEKTRVLMCDATPILEAFPELMAIQNEKERVQKLMTSLGMLFHLARQKTAGKPLPNPNALTPRGVCLTNEEGETLAIWADIPPPPRPMDTKSVNAFLMSVVATGLHQVGMPLQPFSVTQEGWTEFFKSNVSTLESQKEVPSSMVEDLQNACLNLANPQSLGPTPKVG